MIINNSVGAMLPGAILMPCGDNGMNTPFDDDTNREDIVLTHFRKKTRTHPGDCKGIVSQIRLPLGLNSTLQGFPRRTSYLKWQLKTVEDERGVRREME
jgi:hypothetical protein